MSPRISGGARAELYTRVTEPAPGQGAVELSYGHLPSVYKFHFAERRKDDAVDLVCDEVTLSTPDATVRVPLIRDLADNFDRYERAARASLAAMRQNGEEIAPRPVRRQRELSDDFLREVVRRHGEHERAGRPPTKTLAAEEEVSVGAVKNWLRQARERGLTEEAK